MGLLDGMITSKEAAELIGIGSQTLTLWRRNGQHLPYYRVGGVIRYDKSDVEKFIESCKQPVMPAPTAPAVEDASKVPATKKNK